MNNDGSSAIYGMLSALAYGFGDFVGGVNSKCSSVLSVILFSQLAGWMLYLACALLFREAMPPVIDLIVAGAAGVIGVIGVGFIYQALSLGYMGITAPVSGVLAAAIPVVIGAATQGMPDARTLVGFGVGLIAVWLVAGAAFGGRIDQRALTLALLGGTAFGFGFVLYDRAAEHATVLPLIVARSTSITFMIGFGLVMRRRLTPEHRPSLPLILLGGVLDALGNLFFIGAAQAGQLAVASVLSSLYPAVTVLCAWVILKERLKPLQWIGVGAALAAIALIVA